MSSAANSFCEPDTRAYSDSELRATYSSPSGGIPRILPQSFQVDENDIISDQNVNAIIQRFKNNNILPKYTNAKDLTSIEVDVNNPKYDFNDKIKKLYDSIKVEYCFYEKRYKFSFNKLIENVSLDSTTSPDNNRKIRINTYLTLTQNLNRKLNSINKVIIRMTDEINKLNNDLRSEVRTYNSDVLDKKKALEKQYEILSSDQSLSILNKKMVDYTEEKGRYNNNLLTMYSFLNIVAFGLLIYVYRSAS